MADAFRGRAVLKGRNGTTYMSAWPRPNTAATKEKKRVWFERFACFNRVLKSPPPKVLDEASRQTADTGWYYRDLLYKAAVNDVIRMDGAKRVNVPTVAVTRLSNQTLTAGIDTNINLTAKLWDNAEFWDPAVPNLLTFNTPGLYLVGAAILWTNSSTTGSLYAEIAHSRWGKIVADQRSVNANVNMQGSMNVIVPSLQGDSMTIWMRSNAGNRNAQILQFFAIGITPELVS